MGARVVFHHRQLGAAGQHWARPPQPHRPAPLPPAPPPPPLPTPTLASLKLRRRASLLAPASCTLAMDMTLPKKEKEATSSSFSRCSRCAFPSAESQWVGIWAPCPGRQPPGARPGSHPALTHPRSCHSWSAPVGGRREGSEGRTSWRDRRRPPKAGPAARSPTGLATRHCWRRPCPQTHTGIWGPQPAPGLLLRKLPTQLPQQPSRHGTLRVKGWTALSVHPQTTPDSPWARPWLPPAANDT